MNDDRLGSALARLEAAVTRAETAAARAPSPPGDTPELARLQARYDLLRSRVEAAVAGIDRLLETPED